MNKLYYCKDCMRVIKEESNCNYCNSHATKELVCGAPVNVIGSKLKGKVLKVNNEGARLLIRDENNTTFIKEYEAGHLRKIL